MITDGKSNDPVLSLTDSANKWKKEGIKTYALGYGNKVDEEGLSFIITALSGLASSTQCLSAYMS